MCRRTILTLLVLLWATPLLAAEPTEPADPTNVARQSSEVASLARKIAALEQQNSRQLQAVLDLTAKVDRLLLAPDVDATKMRTIRVIPAQNGQPQQRVPGTVEYRNNTTIFTADKNSGYSGPQVVSFRREDKLDKSPVPLDSVPEWELSQTVGGRHVIEPQTGVPVYALSEWIVRKHGPVKVIEAIRLYGRPVPVGAVHYGDMSSASSNGRQQRRRPPTYNYNFGGPQQ